MDAFGVQRRYGSAAAVRVLARQARPSEFLIRPTEPPYSRSRLTVFARAQRRTPALCRT